MNVQMRGSVSGYAREALDVLRSIAGRISAAIVHEQDWDALDAILAATPMAAEEYGLLVNRLLNARQYACTGETGAARFELRLLERRLKEFLDFRDAAGFGND